MAHTMHHILSVGDRLREVVGHLPHGPFSQQDFANHATGLNALSNQCDVGPFLDQLVAEGVIYRLGKNIAMWAVVSDAGCTQAAPHHEFPY